MSIPVWVLLAFAVWTVILLFGTVGVYRWSRILTGKVPIQEFKGDEIEGEDWYKRAMRAHANCVENLPVLAAIVFALYVSDTTGAFVNVVSIVILLARILQSLVHVSFVPTPFLASVRFVFYFVQVAGFFVLVAAIINHVFFGTA